MRGRRDRTRFADLPRHAFVDLYFHVGGDKGNILPRRADQHIGEDGNGVAPFDDTLDMAEAFEKGGTFKREFHG
jgi:hypothetical protein